MTLQTARDSNNPVGFLAKAVFFHSKILDLFQLNNTKNHSFFICKINGSGGCYLDPNLSLKKEGHSRLTTMWKM
jgi:hypothetical protein